MLRFVMVAFAVLLSACTAAVAPTSTGTGDLLAAQAEVGFVPPPSHGALDGLRLQRITDALEQPVAIAALDGASRLLVAERTGRIRLIADGFLRAKPVLDLTGRIRIDGTEQGLLGIAVQERIWGPDRLFVLATDPNGNLQLVEYPVETTADEPWYPMRGRRVLTIRQPHKHHQGGGLVFGPDGYLWVSLGDGGGIGDTFGNGQNPHTLLGTIVRIDVDQATPYAIPPDNPFADGKAGAPEVWAYGLRNPWRISHDEPTGRVYIADVGQDAYEEINVVATAGGGANFGWPVREGPTCFRATSCEAERFVAPTSSLLHENLCAVVGGVVYRGALIPELHGHYFYGDFCVGWVRSLLLDDAGTVAETREWTADLGRVGNITTFGVDGAGELLVATMGGELFRIVPKRAAPGA